MESRFFYRMNEQVNPTAELVEQTISAVEKRDACGCMGKRVSKRIWRPVLTLAAVLILCLGGFSALAASDEATYQFLYQLSPRLAQSLKPVREACEDQGIRMEVVSVKLSDNTADIVVSLQDMEGDRLDETTDLFDSYSLNRPFGGSAGCQMLGFDAKSRTVYFAIHMEEQGGTSIAGSKITFSIKRLLSQKTEVEDEVIPLALDGLGDAEVQCVRLSGWGGDADDDISQAERAAYAVLASQGVLYELSGDMWVSAIGLVDGRLHVQMAVRDNLRSDNHGSFVLRSAEGVELQPDVTVRFNDAENQAVLGRVDYTEAVFDMPGGGMEEYEVLVDHVQSGLMIEGDWQVTFRLEE